MMKKRVALLLAGLVCFGCSQPVKEPVGCSSESACEPGTDGKEQPEMQEIDFDQAIQFFDDGEDGLLFFGFTDCPWCQQARPVLAKALQESDFAGPVLYVRTRDDEHNRLYTDAQKERIMPYIQDYMQENEEGELTLYVPMVLRVKDGRVQSGHVATVEGHDASERDMTEDEIQELETIYLDMLK